jgi:hypothetical protein
MNQQFIHMRNCWKNLESAEQEAIVDEQAHPVPVINMKLKGL